MDEWQASLVVLSEHAHEGRIFIYAILQIPWFVISVEVYCGSCVFQCVFAQGLIGNRNPVVQAIILSAYLSIKPCVECYDSSMVKMI